MLPTYLWLMRHPSMCTNKWCLTYLWLMRHPSMCTNKWCLTASTLPSQSSPQNSMGVKLQLCSKQSLKCTFLENFLATGGCFQCNTYHVTALG